MTSWLRYTRLFTNPVPPAADADSEEDTAGLMSLDRPTVGQPSRKTDDRSKLGGRDDEELFSVQVPAMRVSVRDFPEFDVAANELQEFEQYLHSLDETMCLFSDGGSTNPVYDVVLRLESVPRETVKRAYGWVKVSVLAGVLNLIAEFTWKMVSPEFAFRRLLYSVWQIVVSGGFTVAAAYCCTCFEARRRACKGMNWTRRRRYFYIEAYTIAAAMLISNVFWMLPNIYLVAVDCDWFSWVIALSAWIRWMMVLWIVTTFIARALSFNFFNKNKMFLDLGMEHYMPLMLLWLLPTVLATIFATQGSSTTASLVVDTRGTTDCKSWEYNCSTMGNPSMLTMRAYSLLIYLYMPVFFLLVLHGFRQLQRLPYSTTRLANVLANMTFRQNVVTYLMITLSQVPMGWILPSACATWLGAWATGLCSMQVVLNGTVLLPTLLFVPEMPSPEHFKRYVHNAYRGLLHWNEQDRDQKNLVGVGKDLQKMIRMLEPPKTAFCFETAMKCVYWNWCVYMHSKGEYGDDWGPFDILTALNMSGMKNYDVLTDPVTQSKCVIAWHKSNVLLAFRGSVTLKNLWYNMKMWRHVHPPRRMVWTRHLIDAIPRVHHGFYTNWYGNGFNEAVINRVQQIVEEQGRQDGSGVEILITGHSSGGAMAILAALDMKFKWDAAQLRVYTFGCPHVGNKAFMVNYDDNVKDTWNLVNDQDAVARSGKASSIFLRLFERPGTKVLIDVKGNMVVAPTALESYLALVPGVASWDDHVFSSYDKAMILVCKAQFSAQGIAGGMAGMLGVLQNMAMRKFCSSRGLDVYAEIENVRKLFVEAAMHGGLGRGSSQRQHDVEVGDEQAGQQAVECSFQNVLGLLRSPKSVV